MHKSKFNERQVTTRLKQAKVDLLVSGATFVFTTV